MQSSIADYTGQFLQYYRTIKMMQHEYRISKIRAKQHDGEQIYLWESLAEYLTEQIGTGTKKLGRCFSVSLRLMSSTFKCVQETAVCKGPYQSCPFCKALLNSYRKPTGLQEFCSPSSICVPEANVKDINTA